MLWGSENFIWGNNYFKFQRRNIMSQYNENMQRVYDDLQREVEVLSTPCVPALEKLNASGNKMYIDEKGVLRAVPVGHAKSIAKYLENSGLVKSENTVAEGSVFCDTSASLV